MHDISLFICLILFVFATGPNKIFVTYYRKKVFADLLENGSVKFDGKVYRNMVTVALVMKRTLNPSKISPVATVHTKHLKNNYSIALRTDPGWASLLSTDYQTSLKELKEALYLKRMTGGGTSSRSVIKTRMSTTATSDNSSQENGGRTATKFVPYFGM